MENAPMPEEPTTEADILERLGDAFGDIMNRFDDLADGARNGIADVLRSVANMVDPDDPTSDAPLRPPAPEPEILEAPGPDFGQTDDECCDAAAAEYPSEQVDPEPAGALPADDPNAECCDGVDWNDHTD